MDWISPQTVIQQGGYAPLKSLGQNFMQDRNVLEFMLNASDLNSEEDAVVEIGPGTGALTQYLMPHSKEMRVFELDHGLAAYLKSTYESDRFKVIEGDIMASKQVLHPSFYEFLDTVKADGKVTKLISNLPYNILTPLLWNFLSCRDRWERGVFLVQREFAERLRAKPSSSNYAPLTVYAQLVSKVEVLRPVSKNCFWPAPDVESSIIRVTPHEGETLEPAFLEFVKKGFSQRRKTLTKIMKKDFSVEKLEASLEELGFSPKSRAESLDPASLLGLWLKLSS